MFPARKKESRSARPLALEKLEDRTLLSIVLNNGVLTINANTTSSSIALGWFVSGAVNVTLDAAGTCTDARVALGAVAPTALLVPDAANALIGHKLDGATLAALDAAARGACKPIDDKRGTFDYRIKVAGVLARRAAAIAFARAGAAA